MTISSKDIAITLSITVAIAIIIIVVFVIISGQKDKEAEQNRTQELIDQIKKQALDDKGELIAEDESSSAKAAEDLREKTFIGVLESIDEDILLVTDSATEELIRITLTDKTNITYNGKNFDKADFYQGDQLQILAQKEKQNQWEALNIVVKFSASPETEAPVPQGLQEREDGSFKPLG